MSAHPIATRDPGYLDFIRSRPCAFCGSEQTEPHHSIRHLRGVSSAAMGQKGSDFLSIPVCRRCHTKIHSGQPKPSREDLLELIVTYLICYLNKHPEKVEIDS